MRELFVLLLAVGFCQFAQGAGLNCANASYLGQNVTCRSYDSGWEEHFGGHASCGECTKKHGHCYEECTAVHYTCTAEGERASGQSSFTESFQASDASQWRAQDEALDRCYQSGDSNCHSENCNSENEVVSHHNC